MDQSLADAESAASQPELQPQAGALQSETDAQQLETEARQSQSLSAKDLKRRADTFIDEPIPPPAGLIDQSRLGAGFEQQGLGDQSSGYTSPESRYRMNERFRNRIDELKRRLADMVDGSEKEQLLGELDEAYDGYRATRDGLIDTGTVMGGEEARGMTKPQRTRLLGLMADYDMSKPSDVAKWNQLKSEELGR